MDLAPENSETRTDVSLITGGIRQLGMADTGDEACELGSQAVIKRDEKMFAISSVGATSGGGRSRCHCVSLSLADLVLLSPSETTSYTVQLTWSTSRLLC